MHHGLNDSWLSPVTQGGGPVVSTQREYFQLPSAMHSHLKEIFRLSVPCSERADLLGWISGQPYIAVRVLSWASGFSLCNLCNLKQAHQDQNPPEATSWDFPGSFPVPDRFLWQPGSRICLQVYAFSGVPRGNWFTICLCLPVAA